MGNMGDALKKAGLVSEKDNRRRKHTERVERKELGREGLDQRERETQRQRGERRDAKRSRDRKRERDRQQAGEAKSDQARARDLARRHAITRGLGGPRRFHFVDRDGRIPFVSVQDDLGRRIEAGEFAIVTLGGETLVVPRAEAETLHGLDAEAVRFLAGLTTER